jgi:hypothetical protein
MEFNGIIWIAAGVIALLALLAASKMGASRRKGNDVEKKDAEPAPIYTSGVFSLIRKSPREAILAKVPDLENVRSVLKTPAARGEANGTPEQYQELWLQVANLCISNIERGDKDGIQTYRYVVPEKCRATCGRFGGDAYVTREQLHHQVQLIPPFHLGCGCEITPREAWQGGSGGWSPILPVNGHYDTPDWRIVVRL